MSGRGTRTNRLIRSCFRRDGTPKKLVHDAEEAALYVDESARVTRKITMYSCATHKGFHFARIYE